MAKIYLIRHGETTWNREKRLQGHLDIGLNERGYWQADRIGEYLADKSIAAVISSDLSRAVDTAKAVAKHHGLNLQYDAGLRERHYGLMQGLSHEEIAQKHPRNHLAWKNREVDFEPESGESLRQFYDRVIHSATHWASQYDGQDIVIVAHGGVLDCLNRAATNKTLAQARDFEILNASLNTLSYKNGRFELIQWGDVSHLESSTGQLNKSLDEVDGSPR
ncbi:MAG: histidine phosphatase family protein [Polynucleobacter victoriensis]